MKITKETIKRAFRTFLQSAFAYVCVNAVYINFTGDKTSNKSAFMALLMSAVAAGFSGAMNLEKEEQRNDEV